MKVALKSYGIAVVAVGVATALRLLINPWITLETPFLTYFLAVLLAAWLGGLGPGLFSALLSTVTASYFFIPPYYTWTFTYGEIIPLIIFCLEAAACSVVSERWKHALRALRTSQQELHDSEALLQKVLKILPVGVWLQDATGHIVSGNPAGQAIWGGARYVGIEQFSEYKDGGPVQENPLGSMNGQPPEPSRTVKHRSTRKSSSNVLMEHERLF